MAPPRPRRSQAKEPQEAKVAEKPARGGHPVRVNGQQGNDPGRARALTEPEEGAEKWKEGELEWREGVRRRANRRPTLMPRPTIRPLIKDIHVAES